MNLLDSGARLEFGSGAVRDVQDGKGRCDLLPLEIVGGMILKQDDILLAIGKFVRCGGTEALVDAARTMCVSAFGGFSTAFLELSKHFEDGARKYEENNWQKGIPVHCYINSAIRHYLKWMRGDNDEPHDRAMLWNIVCCIWTLVNNPELDDVPHIGGTDGQI